MWDPGEKHLDTDLTVIVRGLDGVFTPQTLLWCAQNDAVEAGDFWVMRSQLPAEAPAAAAPAAAPEAGGPSTPWTSSNVRTVKDHQASSTIRRRPSANDLRAAGAPAAAAAPAYADLGALGHMLQGMASSLLCGARVTSPVCARGCFGSSTLSNRVRYAQAGAQLLDSYLRIVYAGSEQRWRVFRNGTVVSGTRDSPLVVSSADDLADCTICRERFNKKMYSAESERVQTEFRVEGNWDAVVFHGLKTTIFVVLPHASGEDDAEVGRKATAIAQLDADEAAANSGGALARIISPLDEGEEAGLAMADVAGRLAATEDGVG
tara:strand:- start:2055 stop:3014 length:960 start_codon:yes stop_codon:yes gene_type:complete